MQDNFIILDASYFLYSLYLNVLFQNFLMWDIKTLNIIFLLFFGVNLIWLMESNTLTGFNSYDKHKVSLSAVIIQGSYMFWA